MSIPSGFRAENLLPTRYSLLSRLEDRDDHESWKDFFDTYWRLIYSLAVKSGLTETEAQDVVQETVICVARDIHKFKRDRGLGSFKGWLRNIIRWRITDQFRKRSSGEGRNPASEPGTMPEPDLNEIPDGETSGLENLWQAEWEANLFEAATQRVKRTVKEEHYQIFDLYVVKGWPVLKVSRTLRVSVGKIYVVKHRVAGLVKKEIEKLESTLI